MARTKEQKKEIIEKLKTMMSGAKSLVFVSFHKLTVAEATTMRKALRKEGVNYFVAKKTLVEKALESGKYTGTMPKLIGEFGMAYGTDLVAPARGVYEFQKKFKDKATIVGGVFESAYMSKEEMMAIALIPPREVLLGMLVNVMNSPIQGMVIALNEVAKKGGATASPAVTAPEAPAAVAA